MEREEKINSLKERLREAGCTEEEMNEWLTNPHKLLGNDTPMDRINQNDFDSVEALIEQIESGAFV